jgi:DNA-binding transcriptional LysR family regulator
MSMTHQAVSRNIRKLEEEIGYKLFTRNSQTVSLTKAGEFFLSWLTEVDDRLRWAFDYFYNENSYDTPRVRIAFADWLGIPSSIRYSAQTDPGLGDDIPIDLYIGSEEFILDLLRGHNVDIIVLPGRPEYIQEDADIFTTPLLGAVTLQLAYGRQFVGGNGTTDYKRLFSEKLFVCSRKGRLDDRFDLLNAYVCGIHGCAAAEIEYLDNFASVVSEVILGNGFTFATDISDVSGRHGEFIKSEPLADVDLAKAPIVCAGRLHHGAVKAMEYIERLGKR